MKRYKVAVMLEITALSTALIGPIDLTVKAGECVGIMGASGSGKSRFLRAIADLDPNQGAVFLEGRARESFDAPTWRRKLGLVPSESGWWAAHVGAHFIGQTDPSALLGAVGLAEASGWEVARLSTGEKQRLALVRTLQNRPRVLLLDEPTAALDAAATEAVEALMQAQLAAGVAIILITHDPQQADRLCERRFTLQKGQLEAVVP